MSRRSLRSALSIAGVGIASLVLAGCFSVESTFTINDDATADVNFVMLIDTDKLGEISEMMGEDLGPMGDLGGDALIDEMMGDEDPCGDMVEDLSGYESESNEIDSDGSVGVECTVKSVPLAELNESMSDSESTFLFEQDDTGTRFSGTLLGVDELTDMGEMGDMGDMGALLGEELDDIFTITFTVSAPGSLGDNNASSTDGSTATWDVKPDAGFVVAGDAEMHAEWTPGGGSSSSSTLWIILGIVAAVLIIGGIVFFLSKRNKGETPPSGGTDAVGPPTGTDQAPPPPGVAPTSPMPPPPPAADVPPPAPPAAPPTAPPPPPPA